MTEPTNADRAARALKALAAYKGTESGPPDSQETISDFLADLHHLLDAQKQEAPDELLDSWLRSAHDHFERERAPSVQRYSFNYTVLEQYCAAIDVPKDVRETKIEDYIQTHRDAWIKDERIDGSHDVEIVSDTVEKA